MPSVRRLPVKIKQALPEDSPEIIRLANACILDLAGTDDRRIVGLVSERIKIDLERHPRTCLVAYEGEKLVGFSLTEVAGSSASILLLAVDSRHRRKGVGSALVSSTVSLLKDSGVGYLDLETPSGNETAQSFWTSRGFADARMRSFSKFLGHRRVSRPRLRGKE